MNVIKDQLPVCPNKRQIAHHFGYRDVTFFFRRHFFNRILPDCGYTYDQMRYEKRLPADLAQKLYLKYQINRLKDIGEY